MRHDKLTSVWRSLIRKAGLPSSLEPRLGRMANTVRAIARASLHRADITTVMDTEVVLTDTVVVHPAASTYRSAASRTNGAAAKQKEGMKLAAFRLHGDPGGAELVPLATESYGRHGQRAMQFLSKLGNVVASNGGSKSLFVRTARTELSVALAWGVTAMYNQTLFNVVRAAGNAFLHGHECVVSDHCDE